MKYIVEYNTFRERNFENLNEGSLARGLLTDALQFMVGAAAEYGVGGAIAVGTVGAGTPVGPAIETIIDCGFAAETITSAISQVTELKGQFDKFTDIINKCMESFKIFKSGNFEKFYSTVKQIIIDGIDLLKGEETVDKLAEKLRDIISDLISKITDAVGKGLKILIPDATVGMTLTAAIKVVVEKASNSGYDIAVKAVDALGEYKKYLIDPEKFPALLKELFPEIYKLIDGFKKKIEELGWAKAIVFFGANGLILKKLGPSGLDQIKKTVQGFEPTVIDLVKKVLGIVVPTTFIFLAVVQILLKEEYKTDKKVDVGSEEKSNDLKSEEKKEKV